MNEVYVQLSLFRPYVEAKPFPCDTCGLDIRGCCNYPDTSEDYCVLGDKWTPRKAVKS